jgi:hypothetical protein
MTQEGDEYPPLADHTEGSEPGAEGHDEISDQQSSISYERPTTQKSGI